MGDERRRTPGSEYWLDERGFVRGAAIPDAHHGTMENARAAIEALRSLNGGTPAPLLFDARHVGRYDREARSFMIEASPEVISAAAVVVNSRLLTAASYFFLGLANPRFPVKFFVRMDRAEEWIATQIDAR